MHRLPTIRGVNRLYLLTMLLVVTVGTAMQAWNAVWGLVATEWLIILPSALIYLRLAKLPVPETMRLHWPGAKAAGLVLIIGIGTSLFVLWLGVIVTTLFGYTFSIPPGLYPRDIPQAFLLFFAMTISAPLCEESLFRGVIQRGYERRGPQTGILVAGLLFALYHLSFQRLIILLPVALTLGYVAWRNNSLVSSILVHFSYNAMATTLLVVNSLRPDLNLDFFGGFPAALMGFVIAVAGLWWLRRITTPIDEPAEPETTTWLSRAVPMALAGLIFLTLAGAEFVLGRFPQVLASSQVRFANAPWHTPVQWNYELRNALDEPVGQAQCSLAQEEKDYLLDCQVQQEAFQAQKGKSFYQTNAYESNSQARWSLGLNLLEAQSVRKGEGVDQQSSLRPNDSGLELSASQNNEPVETLQVPSDALLMGEWPWRLSAIPLQNGYIANVALAWPSRWSENANRSLPSLENEILNVQGAEPVAVPAGNFIAWKVTLGEQTAWYDTQAPYTLLRYDDGFETYVLTSVN